MRNEKSLFHDKLPWLRTRAGRRPIRLIDLSVLPPTCARPRRSGRSSRKFDPLVRRATDGDRGNSVRSCASESFWYLNIARIHRRESRSSPPRYPVPPRASSRWAWPTEPAAERWHPESPFEQVSSRLRFS